jgi:hypothetical protein
MKKDLIVQGANIQQETTLEAQRRSRDRHVLSLDDGGDRSLIACCS